MKETFKKFSVIMVVIALILSAAVPGMAFAESSQVKITILGTTDIHGNIYDWSYEDGKAADGVGLTKIYTLVKQVRKENPNTLLVDNGDTTQGTVLTDDLYNVDLKEANPMIDVMNLMGYDSMTLGNHEFNFGLELIDKIVKEAKFPILSANTYNKADGTNFVKPYVIKEVSGVKIGILGLTTPNIPRWDGPKVTTLEFKHMAEEAEKYVKILKEQEKVDLVFVSAHADLKGEYDANKGDAAEEIIKRVSGIDGLLKGHDHKNETAEINGVLVGGAKDKGAQVVRYDFTLEKQGAGFKVVDKKVQLLETKGVAAAEEIKTQGKKYHEKTLGFLKEVLATSTGLFHPVSEIAGIPEAQIRDTAVIDLINKVQLKYTGADVSAAALFKNDSNIKPGPVTYSSIFDIYKYPNSLNLVEVNGKELKNYMEWSAAYYNTYKPGDVTVSFNPQIRGYNYDIFAGVDYEIDISKPAGERIVNLKFKGQPVTEDQVFKLAINNYRYGAPLKTDKIISKERSFDSDPKSIRSFIADYIKEMKTISPEVDNNWKLVGANLNHWAKADAVKLINKGIMEIPVSEDGRTPNVKAVNLEEKVTRGEFIRVLVKTLGITVPKVETTKFTDVDKNLAPYVEAAVNAKITNGVSSTLFGTNDVLSREQAFTLLMGAIASQDSDDLTVLNKFTDNAAISNWAKKELARAVNLGIVSGRSDKTIQPAVGVSRGEMASILCKYIEKAKGMERFVKVDLLTTNDFHGNLEGGSEAGAAKLAAYMNYYKDTNPEGTLILDAGDAFQGTPLSNVHKGKPVVEMMNAIGYEAMAVGNHEFDWGIDAVLSSLKGSKVKLLTSNIYKDGKLVDWATPYTIIEKNGVKIGVIGLSTPDTAFTAHADFVGAYEFKNPVDIANTLIPKVRAEGAEIVVLLTHLPGEQNATTKAITGELADLAKGAKGADAVIGGHSHLIVTGELNGVAVVEADKNGRKIGHITLDYDKKEDKVVGKAVETIEVRNGTLAVQPDAKVQAIVDKYNKDLEPIFGEVIGKTKVALTRDYNKESNIGNWITDVMKEKSGVQIAFTNAGGIRTDVPAGDIKVRDIFTVMPFDNTVMTAEMTGEQIKATLEQSVTLFKGMLQISGLKFTYDSSKPEGQRVQNITLTDGKALDMKASYKVATNDFLATGGDGFVTLKNVIWTNTYILVRDILLEDVRAKKEIAPAIEGRAVDVKVKTSFNLFNLPKVA